MDYELLINVYNYIIRYFYAMFPFQTDEQEVINFLLTTEIIPLCLRIMESGSELSKTVATFILQKILLDETGLSYICQTFERFSHVSSVLVRGGEGRGGEGGGGVHTTSLSDMDTLRSERHFFSATPNAFFFVC